jgi:hypothetical protein
MKQITIIFFLSIFFLFPLVDLMSQNNFSDQNIIIDIKIDGLKRTKQSTAEEPLQQFLGMNAESINIDDVKAAILSLGILEPLEVSITDAEDQSGKTLFVIVHEKWSIIPVPVFALDPTGYKVGAMFMDSNAFGLNDKFALGGMYGTSGWMAALMYFHQGRKGVPGLNTAIMYSSGTQEYQNQNEENIRLFELDTLTAMLGLSYDFTKLFSSSANVSFYMGEISRNRSSFAVPKDDAYYINARLSSKIDKADWDGFFLSQKSASASFEYSFGIEGPSFFTVKLQGDFEQSILPEFLPGLRAFTRAAIIYSPDAPPLRENSAGSASIDILPGSFSAKNYVGGSAGLEKSLFRFFFGTISIFTSYQLVYSYGPILEDSFDHGIAGGLRVYMSKLAMPALGFGVSYNVAASYYQFYFNIGMTM